MTTDRQQIAWETADKINSKHAGCGWPEEAVNEVAADILRALEQAEGWVSAEVSELVKAAERVSDWEHLTMETFDKTYPEIANLSLTEKADAVWQPLLTALAAYKAVKNV